MRTHFSSNLLFSDKLYTYNMFQIHYIPIPLCSQLPTQSSLSVPGSGNGSFIYSHSMEAMTIPVSLHPTHIQSVTVYNWIKSIKYLKLLSSSHPFYFLANSHLDTYTSLLTCL